MPRVTRVHPLRVRAAQEAEVHLLIGLRGGLGPIPSYRGGAQRPTTQPAMAPNTIPVTRIGA